ncbi:hypothetical protein N431DRAFT_119410 [Stipitochalara longipes BDJ]|nr:hypothetical protein N431DRAFT_119410 [Stipitochalara longipes BDJ]
MVVLSSLLPHCRSSILLIIIPFAARPLQFPYMVCVFLSTQTNAAASINPSHTRPVFRPTANLPTRLPVLMCLVLSVCRFICSFLFFAFFVCG